VSDDAAVGRPAGIWLTIHDGSLAGRYGYTRAVGCEVTEHYTEVTAFLEGGASQGVHLMAYGLGIGNGKSEQVQLTWAPDACSVRSDADNPCEWTTVSSPPPLRGTFLCSEVSVRDAQPLHRVERLEGFFICP